MQDMFEIPTDDDIHQRNSGYRNVGRVVPARRPHHTSGQVRRLQPHRVVGRNHSLHTLLRNCVQKGRHQLRSRSEFSKRHVGYNQDEASVPHLLKEPHARVAELLLEAPAEHRRICINTQRCLHTSSLSLSSPPSGNSSGICSGIFGAGTVLVTSFAPRTACTRAIMAAVLPPPYWVPSRMIDETSPPLPDRRRQTALSSSFMPRVG